jgi:hypothetical protein
MVTASDLAASTAPEGVHAHIPQRPLFTASSRPSLDEVGVLTVSTARAIVGAVGGALPDDLLDYAVTVCEVGTAAKVEQSYFPEQQGGGSAAAELLWSEYNDGLTRLVAQTLAGRDRTQFSAGTVRLASPTFGLPRSRWCRL